MASLEEKKRSLTCAGGAAGDVGGRRVGGVDVLGGLGPGRHAGWLVVEETLQVSLVVVVHSGVKTF